MQLGSVVKSCALVIVVEKGLDAYQHCAGSSLPSFLAALSRRQCFPVSIGKETEAQAGSGLSLRCPYCRKDG